MIGQLAALKGTTEQGTEQLLKVLELHDQLNVQLDKLHAYASHKFDQDMRQSKQQALRDRARTLVAKYRKARAWLEPELTSCPRTSSTRGCDATTWPCIGTTSTTCCGCRSTFSRRAKKNCWPWRPKRPGPRPTRSAC